MRAFLSKTSVLAFSALAWSIFASLPKISAAQQPASGQWATPSSRGTSAEKSPNEDWWNSFHDDELTRLVQRAISRNLDLRLAALRVEESRAARGIAKSAF